MMMFSSSKILLLVTVAAISSSRSFLVNSLNLFSKVRDDYLALTRRVTARHILLPSGSKEGRRCDDDATDAILALKQRIRTAAREEFVADVFERAARKFSRDDATRARGGLVGELVPQGACRWPELDEACFQVRLGVVEGPIESKQGMHLLLVTERTNCPKLDGKNTKLIVAPAEDAAAGKTGILVPSEPVGQVTGSFVLGQIGFWMFAFLAGGIFAELVATLMPS